jgi:hypothetical protein
LERRRPTIRRLLVVSDSLAEQIVARIGAWPNPVDEFSEIEVVESVVVDGVEGLVLLWTQTAIDQGVRKFGLIVDSEEIAGYGVGVERIAGELRIMVMEPQHTQAGEHARTWFRSMEGFIS